MRISERDARQRNLTTIFFPQEARRVMPEEVSEEIILTHPVQPFGASLHEMRADSITGAATVLLVPGLQPVDPDYFWMHGFSCFHTDAAARDLRLGLEEIATGVQIVFAFEQAVPTARILAVNRSVLVGPRFRIFAGVNALAATFTLTLRSVHVNFQGGEVSPPF